MTIVIESCSQNSQDKTSKPRGKGHVQTEALLKTAMAQIHIENRDRPQKSQSDLRRHIHVLYSDSHFKLENRQKRFPSLLNIHFRKKTKE